MGTVKGASDQPGDRLLGGDRHAGPALPRMILGARLRRLRESGGLTCEQAGEAIRSSASKICRIELGRTGCKPRDVADLLTHYGVLDEAERATVLALARQANTPGWWQSYHEVIPPWMQPYLGLEQAAQVIRAFEVQFVPGLLQTEEYARAVIRLAHRHAGDAEIERRVELRMGRQDILHRPGPARLWAVIDEAVLHRPVGGASVMRHQIRHLIAMGGLPNVTVQILPFAAGGHAGAGGPVTLLRLPGDGIPDVVYLEQLDSALYPNKPEELDHYRHVMNRLVTEAEPADASRTFLHRILKQVRAGV